MHKHAESPFATSEPTVLNNKDSKATARILVKCGTDIIQESFQTSTTCHNLTCSTWNIVTIQNEGPMCHNFGENKSTT